MKIFRQGDVIIQAIERIEGNKIDRLILAEGEVTGDKHRISEGQAELYDRDGILLKMTCPSTKHIHALRVPPDLQTAREAIRWINWDIDPEEFSIQT
jgi:hypothetical protein